jgi:hypothetical protein
MEDQIQQLKKVNDLLKEQQEYFDNIKKAAGGGKVTRDTSGGRTQYDGDGPIFESVALSYSAARELAQHVDSELKPSLGSYRAIVIYYDKDFDSLVRYRLLCEQIRVALANYEAIVTRVNEGIDESAVAGMTESLRIRSLRQTRGSGALLTGLNIPSISTEVIGSVGQLLSLFRSDTTITQTKDVISNDSLGTIMAGVLLKSNPQLTVFHPAQFSPEYDLGVGEETSLYSQLSRVNAAESYVKYFLDETGKLPPSETGKPALARIIAAANVVGNQIRTVSAPFVSNTRGLDSSDKTGLSELRQMLRAEKLDHVLKTGSVRYGSEPTSGKVGILKLKVLSSGGSRRETKSLLFGGKTDFSGQAIIEVALYDSDGSLRASEIFSHHTGFRKLDKEKQVIN